MPPTIKSVRKDPPAPLSMLLYGPHKAGKTTFIATMPSPVFIVPQGRGTGSLKDVLEAKEQAGDTDADLNYIPVNNRTEMEEACIYVRNNHAEHGWKTAAIDPLSIYGRMLQMEFEAQGLDGWDIWRAVQQDVLNNWNILMGAPMHIVFSLHVDEAKSGDVVLHYKPRLVGKAIDDIAASVDMVAFLEKEDHQVRDGDGKPTGAMKTVRSLWTKCPAQRAPKFEAGCRWEKQLAEGCYVPKWGALAKRLEGRVLT